MSKFKQPVAVCSRTFSKNTELRENLLERFDNVKFNDEGAKLTGSELADYLTGMSGAIVALEPITSDLLESLPELRVISKYGVGLDGLDLEAMKKYQVELGWTAGVNRRSVSELALSLAMNLLRRVHEHSLSMQHGKWLNLHGSQLTGKTVGVIGCGNIGTDFIELIAPFSCEVLVNDIEDKSEFCREVGARQVTKEQLFRDADVITLHVPLTGDTRNLVSAKTIDLMKDNAVLVNTSRGGVVNESELAQALSENKIGGAALDVFVTEPPDLSDFEGLVNFIATPHNGGSSREGVLAMGQSAIENLARAFAKRNL